MVDSSGREMTDCEKYIQEGIRKGWCKEISFEGKIKCTYVCDFFQEKIFKPETNSLAINSCKERKVMEQIEKKLEDITRKEWVAYRWIEIPATYGDEDERMFRTAGRRTPDESYQALEEWEMTAEDRGCIEPEPEPEKGIVP